MITNSLDGGDIKIIETADTTKRINLEMQL